MTYCNFFVRLKYILFRKNLYTFLHPIYWHLYGKYKLKQTIKQFQANSLSVIAEFDKIMQEGGFEYYLMWGSLLGAIREHGFIKHDADIDIAIFVDQDESKVRTHLKQKGFFLEHDMTVDGGNFARHQCYRKRNVGIDFFWFYYDTDGKPYTCLYGCLGNANSVKESIERYGGVMPIKSKFPFDRTIKKVPFETLLLPIPKNGHEIMRIIYGKDYMTPIPIGKYRPPRDPKYHTQYPNKIAIRIDYKE